MEGKTERTEKRRKKEEEKEHRSQPLTFPCLAPLLLLLLLLRVRVRVDRYTLHLFEHVSTTPTTTSQQPRQSRRESHTMRAIAFSYRAIENASGGFAQVSPPSWFLPLLLRPFIGTKQGESEMRIRKTHCILYRCYLCSCYFFFHCFFFSCSFACGDEHFPPSPSSSSSSPTASPCSISSGLRCYCCYFISIF